MAKAFDSSAFLRGLKLADKRVRRGARRGATKVLLAAERLAKKRVPIEEGTLAGTIVADVDGIVVSEKEISGKLTAGGGEAADYAVRQHEEALHHTHPEEGVYASKFVEGPIKELTPKVARTVADEVRKELG